MKINPGGEIDEVIGRDADIARYWQIIDRQGLILAAERRIGKTTIIKKMHASPQDGYLTFYQDLSKVNKVLDLPLTLFQTVEDNLPRLQQLSGRWQEWRQHLPRKIGPVELSDAQDPWHIRLEKLILALLKAAGPSIKVVLFWDEFPVMLHKIRRNEDDTIAMELLDQLRTLRQEHNNLRLVFTGSIGLHLVLRGLSLAGNPNTPVNDMYPEEVSALSESDTTYLAEKLLLDNLVPPPNNAATLAHYMAQVTEGFAYYVHHIADRLRAKNLPLTTEGIDIAMDSLINDPMDAADFKDYAVRLQRYYEPKDSILAHMILNLLADSNKPLNLDTISNLIRSQKPETADDTMRDVVNLLRSDHYLARTTEKTYLFRWKFIKSWWQENRR